MERQGSVTEGSNTGIDQKLIAFVQRIEKLNEERDAIGEDIKTVYQEAKSSGFETKIIREVIQRRKLDPAERREQDDMRERYEQVLGMFE